jgi:hypothetical protein
LQDITKYISRDAEEHQFPIGAGAGGNVFRGTYRWIDPSTEQVQSLDVSDHIRLMTWSQMIGWTGTDRHQVFGWDKGSKAND